MVTDIANIVPAFGFIGIPIIGWLLDKQARVTPLSGLYNIAYQTCPDFWTSRCGGSYQTLERNASRAHLPKNDPPAVCAPAKLFVGWLISDECLAHDCSVFPGLHSCDQLIHPLCFVRAGLRGDAGDDQLPGRHGQLLPGHAQPVLPGAYSGPPV